MFIILEEFDFRWGAAREGGGVYVCVCGACTQSVHGRSCTIIDPCTPTVPGRSLSGFHQSGRHCLQQARSAVRCSASRMKGELHPSKNRPLVRPASAPCVAYGLQRPMSYLVFWCGHSRDSNEWVLLCICLVGASPCSHYAMRSFPLCGVRVLHPAQYDLSR